ncbi:MAG: hypothetical protein JXQ96_08590 [Cyclobacteriaceae bacterium]
MEFEAYAQFNHELNSKRVIVIGENHFMEANYIIQAELYMHVHKYFGVKNLLIEYGRAEAILYNQYLKTGKREYLEKTSPGMSNHDQFFRNWLKLFEYNSHLNEEDKFMVHGIDFEREPSLSFVVNELLSSYSNHPNIQAIRKALRIRLDTIGIWRDTKSHMTYLRKELEDIYFTDSLNAYYIDYILKNNSYKSSLNDRNKIMLETFLEIDSSEEKYLAQLGLVHTMLNSVTSFTALLNQEPKYKDSIFVANMYKVDSKRKSALNEISECPVVLCCFDQTTGYGQRGQWAIILKDQPSYPPPKNMN